MSYGIEIQNPAGNITISDLAMNYHYVGDAVSNGFSWQILAGYPVFKGYTVSNCPDYPLIFVSGVSDYCIVSVTRLNSTQWTVIIACAEIELAVSPTAPGAMGTAPSRVLAFMLKPATSGGSGGWGAEVYDAAGNVAFSSLKRPLMPVVSLAVPVLPATTWNSNGKATNTYTATVPACTTPAWGFCSGARNVRFRTTSSFMHNAQFGNVTGTTFKEGWQSYISYSNATEMTRSNYSTIVMVIDAANYT
jgi:hypothetical protein